MERNKLRYFIIAVLFLVFGYVARTVPGSITRQASFSLITAGIFFILAIILKKAAAWVLIIIDLLICGGLQLLRLLQFPGYNAFYDSDFGRFVIGGPFETRMFFFIMLGALVGASLELCLRQFNQIGMG